MRVRWALLGACACFALPVFGTDWNADETPVWQLEEGIR